MQENVNIKNGTILLAEPFSLDTNFRRSVVLLCEHHEEGSLGFIINKPLNMKVDQLISDFPEFDANVYFGGPVATDTIHYIHNVGDLIDNSVKVHRGVYWGGDYDKLKFLISSKLVKPENIRFFVGYSGWSAGQLLDEMDVFSWVPARMDANYVFKVRPRKMWQKIMSDKGDPFTVVAQIPDSVSWN